MAIDDRAPEEFAGDLLSRLGDAQPVNVEYLARVLRLGIREFAASGFDGALVRIAGVRGGRVVVRAGIVEGRKRFTIAHEIGHFVLPGRGASSFLCDKRQVEEWSEGGADEERVVNRFAAELLLPAEKIRAIVREKGVSIKTAEFVSKQYQTSLTASALRCIEVAEKGCALVSSVGGVIERCLPSRGWSYYIERKVRLHEGTLAKHLSKQGRVSDCGVVLALAWVSGNRPISVSEQLFEDSILLPGYETVLSILTLH